MSKWYYIGFAVFIVAVFGAQAYEDYSKKECRVAAMQAGKSADDINRICH